MRGESRRRRHPIISREENRRNRTLKKEGEKKPRLKSAPAPASRQKNLLQRVLLHALSSCFRMVSFPLHVSTCIHAKYSCFLFAAAKYGCFSHLFCCQFSASPPPLSSTSSAAAASKRKRLGGRRPQGRRTKRSDADPKRGGIAAWRQTKLILPPSPTPGRTSVQYLQQSKMVFFLPFCSSL